MKLVFSEARSDYGRYLYPYVVWALPEPGETPARFFERGFLPASPQLDRFGLCRNLRVELARYEASAENRRVLRKGASLAAELVPRAAFDYSAERRAAWKAYADQRFGPDVMPFARLDRLMAAPVITHLLQFTDRATGRDAGTVLLYLEEPAAAYYYYAFYDLGRFQQNQGMFMMTHAVELFAARGVRHLYLGTCYSERARYKTQFAGIQFFNGHRWSEDLAELKFMIHQDAEGPGGHLLETTEYAERYLAGSIENLASRSAFALRD